MEEALKALGPSAAALVVLAFMVRYLISRVQESDALSREAHRELVQALLSIVSKNTECIARNSEILNRAEQLLGGRSNG